MENSDINSVEGDYVQKLAEIQDLKTAVAVSLDYAQPEPSQVNDHANWTPNSATDWPTYNRQMTAYDEASALHQDVNLQAAIAKSIVDARGLQVPRYPHDGELKPDHDGEDTNMLPKTQLKGKAPEPRPSIEARIEDLSIKLDSEMPCVYDIDGDTHIYIDPPARQPEQDSLSYQRYIGRYGNPIVMQSSKLLALDSSYFNKCFGSTYQHRIIRRRGLVNKLPNHIKYVIDLTPPAEGEDAVYLTAELCCSETVRKWHEAGPRWNVTKTLIGGQDDHMLGEGTELKMNRHYPALNSAPSGDHPDSPSEDPESTKLELSPSVGFVAFETKSGLIPEYSPVRHRCAIERILIAIQGLDPQLDSAPKVWTTFAVAKYFDITHSPLTDYIVRWLRSYPNSFFIEVMPETTLKIADGLRCYELFRDTFAILVGEEALENIRRARTVYDGRKPINSLTSVYGRKRAELPEALFTSLEYASKAFAERVLSHFMSLVDEKMEWMNRLPEFRKLEPNEYSPAGEQQTLQELKTLLKEYIKGTIYTVLCKDYRHMNVPIEGRSGGDDLFPRKSWAGAWRELNVDERILTRSFWQALSECVLFKGPTNLRIGESGRFYPLPHFSPAECYLHLNKTVQEVFNFDLINLVTRLNQPPTTDFLDSARRFANGNSGKIIKSDSLNGHWKTPAGGMQAVSIVEGMPEAPHVDHPQEDGQNYKNQSFTGKTPLEVSPNDGICFQKESLHDNMSYVKATQHTHSETSYSANEESDIEITPHPDSFLPPEYEAEGSAILFEEHADIRVPEISFDLVEFFHEATDYLGQFASRMLSIPDASVRAQYLELGLTNTLVSLTDFEWKYLPLWAGGNDDGTGGVFADEVPVSYDGFSTAGPKVHTGSANSAASSESSYTILQSVSNSSNPDTSIMANDGYSDTLPRGVAVADESDMPWVGDLYKLKGKGVENPEEVETATLTPASSVTFDSDDHYDRALSPTMEEEREEQRAQILVDHMESMEEETINSENEKNGATDPQHGSVDLLDDLFEGSYSDDDSTINGDFDEDEDEDMVLV